MGDWLHGVSAWALALTLGVAGCGPKHTTTGGSSTGGGGGAQGGQGNSAQGGEGATGTGATGAVAQAGTASGGKAGGPSLPPDGDVPPAVALHKLDLLLMVDNSLNTAEKQVLLADAVGWLLAPPGGTALSADDIHVGIVTSSLGSHGADGAKDVCVSAEDNDHAHLVASMRAGAPSFNDSGFLAWGPEAGASASLDVLASSLQATIAVTGAQGCGYEASLEAWYRFLVDPEPPLNVVRPAAGSTAVLDGIDEVILAQRQAFLRPDSVLAIVTLSDENDCSIQDEGYGWLISRAMPMYRATSACQTNPNDPCCQSCGEQQANAGCPAIAADPACAAGSTLNPSAGEDDLNLRCFDQKGRFGFELLYPVSRYSDALTRQFQFDRAGAAVPNPIFAGQQRHPSQVIYTGIVGVPWQDLADAQSLQGAGLTYLTADELVAQKRWPLIVGDPEASPPVRPSDPFMIEAPYDRAMLSSVHEHPLLPGQTLVPSDSTDPQANVVNGHESANLGNRELQTACIFPLQTPRTCDEAAFNADLSCHCYMQDLAYNRAVCQPPGGGPAGITQYYDGAWPGIRHLQLQRSLGDTAITASACPKVLDESSDDYGYRPAMKALAARVERALAP